MTRPPFPTVLNNSMMEDWRSCPQKFFKRNIQHWRLKGGNIDQHAGGAFAAGIEATQRAYFERSMTADASLACGLEALIKAYGDFECPEDSPKSLPRMIGALEFYYHECWPLEHEQAPPAWLSRDMTGIEFNFTESIGIAHPETGDPILYTGRMDTVCNFAGGKWIRDEKTTKSLGSAWIRSWDLEPQFTGYTWGCKQHGIPIQGAIIRGVSILKTKYDKAEAITYRPTWLVDRWLEQLKTDVLRMIQAWMTEKWEYNMGASCKAYNKPCPFKKVCSSKDEQPWLEADFERVKWDPLTRTSTKL